MSTPQVVINVDENSHDVSIDDENDVEVTETLGAVAVANMDEDKHEVVPAEPGLNFIDYLASPIIELAVGSGDSSRILRAHQALLIQSPFFADAVSEFSEDATVRRIEFANEDLDAMGCFLQFLYTGEYFPRKIGDVLEGGMAEPIEGVDEGERLLKHAKVYNLADKLGVMSLKALAHSKVHLINTSAAGELAYARFVYANTPKSDTTIRKPIASFWGQRSHVLRHEAEADFKALCLEFPEFAFDILNYVLDVREKRDEKEKRTSTAGAGSARKRQRLL